MTEQRAQFTSMKEGTEGDWAIIGSHFMGYAAGLPDRVLAHLKLLDGDYGGFPVDRLQHSLQTATLRRDCSPHQVAAREKSGDDLLLNGLARFRIDRPDRPMALAAPIRRFGKRNLQGAAAGPPDRNAVDHERAVEHEACEPEQATLLVFHPSAHVGET